MSQDLQALVHEGAALLSVKAWDAALEKFQNILKLDPQSEDACRQIAHIHAVRGRIREVADAYFALMDILEARGDLDQALAAAWSIIKIDPQNVNARMRMTLIYQKQGRAEDAVRLSLQLARLLVEVGQGDQAVMLLERALESDSDNLQIGAELAETFISHGHMAQGIAQYRKMAQVYLDKGLLDKAAEALRRVKVVQSDDVEVAFSLGNLYVSLGRLNEAETEFRSILRHDLNHVEALMALGNVCLAKGQHKDAMIAFNKALSINPQDAGAKEKLGDLQQAQGNDTEAVKHWLGAAHIQQMGGNIERAVHLYQRALQLDQTNPTATRELTNLGAPLAPTGEELSGSAAPPPDDEPPPDGPGAGPPRLLRRRPAPEPAQDAEGERLAPALDAAGDTGPGGAAPSLEHQASAAAEADSSVEAGPGDEYTGIASVSTALVDAPAGEVSSVVAEMLAMMGQSLPEEATPSPMAPAPPAPGEAEELEEIQPVPIAAEEPPPAEEQPPSQEALPEIPPEAADPPGGTPHSLDRTLPITVLGELVAPWQPNAAEAVKAEVGRLTEYLENGQVAHALDAYRQLLVQAPDNLGPRLKLAALALENGLLETAAAEYRAAMNQDPANVEAARGLVATALWAGDAPAAVEHLNTLGRVLLQAKPSEGAGAEAIEVLLRAVALDLEAAHSRLALAEAYLAQGVSREGLYHLETLAEMHLLRDEYDQAIEVYSRIFGITAEVRVQEVLAQLYAYTHREGDAIRELKALLARYVEHDQHLFAIAAAEKLVGLMPDNQEMHEKLIGLLEQIGDADKAVQQRVVLAQLHASSGRLEQAHALLEEVLAARPYLHEARRTLVDVLIQLQQQEPAVAAAQILSEHYAKEKKYGDAIEMYAALQTLDPASLAVKDKLATFYMLNNRKKEALQMILSVAEAHEAKGAWGEMVKAYQKALQADPANVDMHYRLGAILADRLQRPKDAMAEFQAAYELDPAHSEAMRRLVQLNLAQNRAFEATRLLRKLIEMDPAHRQLQDQIIAEYRQRIALNPDDFQARFVLGIVFKELGQIEAAIEQFQQTKKVPEMLLTSYNMLGLCFAEQKSMGGFEMAKKQFLKAIDTKGYPEEQYLEIFYHLAKLYEGKGLFQEATKYYGEIRMIDINYRDASERLRQISDEEQNPKVTRIFPRGEE